MPTAVDRCDLLDRHAADLDRMARWIARRCRRECADVLADLTLIALGRGHTFDPARIGIRRWLWYEFIRLRLRPLSRQPVTVPFPAHPDDDGPAFDVAGREPDPAEQVERADTTAAVRAAVGRLPATQRDIIAMIHGLSGGPATQVEVAARLGVECWRVRDAARMARVTLGRLLGGGA